MMMPCSDPLLRVEDVSCYFSGRNEVSRAVDSVSLTVCSGQVLGIVGESGSGKSTLGRAIMRLVPSPPGKVFGSGIRFRGRDILKMSKPELQGLRGNEISIIFQEPGAALDPCFSIGEQVAEVIRLHQKVGRAEAWRLMLQSIELVRIADPERVAKEYPHQFSGGMKQRIMTAIALACRPALLIADEPTTALDVTVQLQILNLIRELTREIGAAVILISHDLGVIAEMCDSVAVMYNGKIVEYRDVLGFFEEPRHPYSQMLFQSLPGTSNLNPSFRAASNTESSVSWTTGCCFAPRCPAALSVCATAMPPRRDDEHGYRLCHIQ